MKIDEQVTTIEQSMQLIKLGMPADKASMVWIEREVFSCEENHIISTGEYILEINDDALGVCSIVAPAFTVADLEDILPIGFRMYGTNSWLNLELYKFRDSPTREYHIAYYEMASGSDEVLMGGQGRTYYFSYKNKSLIDCLYMGLKWALVYGFNPEIRAKTR